MFSIVILVRTQPRSRAVPMLPAFADRPPQTTTFIYSCICMSNFHNGLRDLHMDPMNQTSVFSHVPKSKDKKSEKAAQDSLPLVIE